MKKLLIIFTIIIGLYSCKKESIQPIKPVIKGNIIGTWYSDSIVSNHITYKDNEILTFDTINFIDIKNGTDTLTCEYNILNDVIYLKINNDWVDFNGDSSILGTITRLDNRLFLINHKFNQITYYTKK
jgi:hypothetical protein